MLKKSIVIGLLATSFCSATYAGFTQKLIHHKSFIAKKSAQTALKQSGYTDFTGHWDGYCSNDSEQLSFVIENDENNITIDSEDYTFGGQKSTTDASEYGSNSEIISVDWNEDKSSITASTSGVFKPFTEYLGKETYTSTVSLELKNGKLIMNGAAATDGNGSISFQCTLSKTS